MEVKINHDKITPSRIVRPNETTTVKCSSCDKDLAIINVNKVSSENFYKIQIECPFCHDASWEIDINCKLAIRPAEGVAITNLDGRDNTKIVYRTMEKK